MFHFFPQYLKPLFRSSDLKKKIISILQFRLHYFIMLISPEQEALMGRVFETYLTEHHHGDILQLIADTNEETHLPVVVNAMTLFEANMEVTAIVKHKM